jgi:hypothetical protein
VHRAEVRRVLGFRECSVEDSEKLIDWLIAHVARAERRPELVREVLLGRCRDERIEPPTPDRVGRIVSVALYRAEETLFDRIAGRLAAPQSTRVRELVDAAVDTAVDEGDAAAVVELDQDAVDDADDAGAAGDAGTVTRSDAAGAGPELLGSAASRAR